MKRYALPAIGFLAVLQPFYTVKADDAYFVELGSESSPAQAQKQWESLSGRYKQQLGGLHYYPKAVIQGGTELGTRIQAGPITSKEHAQKLCSRLFAKGVSCFVIEGLKQAPTAVSSLSEHSESAQTLSSANVEAEAAVERNMENRHAPVILPWLAQKQEAREGEVRVAEAIHVPLSHETEAVPPAEKPMIRTTEVATLTPPPPPERPAPTPGTANVPGWLNIAGFSDSDSAISFWQMLRGGVPERTAGLRVRVNKPLLERNNFSTVLNVGPFATQEDANAFCNDIVQPANPELRCGSGNRAEDSKPSILPVMPKYQHSDRYAARRARLSGVSESITVRDTMPSGRTYWAEVINADTEAAALTAWEKLRTDNGDLLARKRSSISASLRDSSKYTVRVGPLAAHEEATELCQQLQGRGFSCRVMYFSAQ